MNHKVNSVGRYAAVAMAVLVAGAVWLAGSVNPVWACGGFFCRQVPIDQAGEQIIFRRDGDTVTAVVLIQYAGEAEDFSWVLPVPGDPELSVGSDVVFQPLELATRPQFNLDVNGEECFGFRDFGPVSAPTLLGGAFEEDSGVEILQELAVGPFDVQVVTSDDAEAMTTWLAENNYDVVGNGPDLIALYVEAKMNFVALKLRKDQGVGDIQPLMVRYKSDRPMIPIRLTAVAAVPDMGIIVWLLGESRAAPDNYLAVEPNLTRLNWYSGSFNAYASYQNLVTAAMDEAGGRGFATDYAGRDLDVVSQLPDPALFRGELDRLRQADSESFYLDLFFNGFFTQTKVLEILRRELPLPPDVDESNYAEFGVLKGILGEEVVSAAQERIVTELTETVIEPLEETIAVFDGDPYMTRLYTTLSPEEMTVDPQFLFNPDLPDQPLERRATLDLDCVNGQTRWSLTLGPGTGRDGEVVIKGFGESPLFGPTPTIDQSAVAISATVSDRGAPQIIDQKTFEQAIVGTQATDEPAFLEVLLALCGNGILGASLLSFLGLALFAVGQHRFHPKS